MNAPGDGSVVTRFRVVFGWMLAVLFGAGVCWAARPAPKRPSQPARSAVVVVRPVQACPAADRAFAAARARYLSRLLQDGGVRADAADDAALDGVLAGRTVAMFVMPLQPTAAQLAALARFRARGGKCLVFYSASPALAAIMGVRLGTYKKAGRPGHYARVAFTGSPLQGGPSVFRQQSAGIFSAQPVPGQARVLAAWMDDAGRSTGDAAVLASSAGWWMTQVLLDDGDDVAKTKFVLSLVNAAVPGAWNEAAWAARRQARRVADWKYGARQRPRSGEIHAVWDHTGQGLYPGDWPRTMRLLKANGVTDLFVNVAGAGFAHYPSKILPVSPTCVARGDQLAACLTAARGTGVRVHAWVLCFNGSRATPARRAVFQKKGWRLKNHAGVETDYLDPTKPELRGQLLAACDEIVRRYAVAGIHLDFVRWYEGAANKPAASAARSITTFVTAANRRVKTARPNVLLTTAVLGTYPSCIRSVGQDWGAWIDAGLIDYAVPMNYTEDSARYGVYLARQCTTPQRAARIISGIGVTANESRLTPRQVVDQINLARRVGVAGVALFDLDDTLAVDVLPILRLGLFK